MPVVAPTGHAARDFLLLQEGRWMGLRLLKIAPLGAVIAVLMMTTAGATPERTERVSVIECPQQAVGAAYTRRVLRALSSGRDVWGNALLRSREGPTYEGVRRHLKPLLLGRAARRRPPKRLTTSGVYYVAFGLPCGVHGASPVALHV